MASCGTLLPVLLVAFALMAGGLIDGVDARESSFVRRRLSGYTPSGPHPPSTDPPKCLISCGSWNCCSYGPVQSPIFFCADTLLDFYNCGSCGKACAVGQVCCSGKCVHLLTDPNNCGKCGHQCGTKQQCWLGLCSGYYHG